MKQSYRVLNLSARYSFITAFLILVGCSSTPKPSSSALHFNKRSDVTCNEAPFSSREPTVYACTTEKSNASDNPIVFITAISDCSLPEPLTLNASTRKLLVGLVNTTILEQRTVNRGAEKNLLTLVSGIMDAEPIVMATFTHRNRSCIEDVIVWQRSEAPIKQKNMQTEGFLRLAHQVYQNLTYED
jgi:hypothetical protein